MTGRRIILRDGTRCTVVAVAFSQAEPAGAHGPFSVSGTAWSREPGAFVALVRFEDGVYATRCLDGASDAPYERPAPTSLPGGGE